MNPYRGRGIKGKGLKNNFMDGFLNLNKPEGITSFSAVASVKKMTGEKKVGHGGTLDPVAIGILPILLGKATRMAEYLHLFPKTYKAEIELGITTDTFDKEGKILAQTDAGHVTKEKLETTLNLFKGIVDQQVPSYSAAKFQGHPLHSLARKGYPISSKRRKVDIFDIGLLEWQWPFFITRVNCGKGTYLRALAHELGQALGCGAVLKNLERESYGPFNLKEAISLDFLKNISSSGQLASHLYPLDFLFKGFSRVILSLDQERRLFQGQSLELDSKKFENIIDGYLPAYNTKGQFLGVLKQEGDLWRWHKVFK